MLETHSTSTKAQAAIAEPKSVSVIMPIRNEAGYIRESLQSVLDQDYPAGLSEIVVVDGMSTDKTREIVLEMAADHPNLRMIDNPGMIVPTGMNIALQQVQGDIIVRVDGHCVIQPDYVRRCVEYLENTDADGVGGPMETVGETAMASAIAQAMSSPFGVGGSAFRTVKDRTMWVDTVAFPAYTREIIHRNGLYDEELVRNQDDEYNYRLRSMGGRILMAHDIRSRYYSRSSLKSLWRQYKQYGFWKVRVMQKHPRQMSPRQFVPPLFVASLIGLSVLSIFTPYARILLAVEAATYVAANLTASLITALRSDIRHLPYLPIAFGILHISYGLGFLHGLLKFANRWKTEANNG